MSDIPADYLVDVLRVDLAQMGCSRVILLGSDKEMTGEDLRVGLARWGVQVMVPPVGERAWIAGLAGEPVGEDALEPVECLRTLLADGLEHGVAAIVATSESLAAWVRACNLAVPTLALDTHGSAAPVCNVVFDMGGVLFRWDPLAMARRVAETDEDAELLANAVFRTPEWANQDAGAVDEGTIIWTAKARLPQRPRPLVDDLVLHWHEHRVPIEGMDELVRDLKAASYHVYLLSNAGESFQRYEAQLPARECFNGMVVSYQERVVKPDARIYQALVDRYGLTPGECLFIDDTPLNVHAARRLGWRGWHFTENVDTLRKALLG